MREHMRSVLLLAALAAVPATLGSAAVRCIATEPTLSSFPLGAVEAEFRRKRAGASMYPHKVEVLQAMEPFVEQHLNILKTVDESWQPQDFLPDMRREDWREKIAELRAECQEIPDALLVAIVGDTVTEEALPTYQTLLNTFEGMEDPTGTSQSPWARWSRGWTAEENRHGDILNKFLYLTGRIDMRAMEVTVHNLIKDGFNPSGEKDPYRGIIYTSFQERATKISHQNVARLCGEAGAKKLAILTTRIAGDEARHEMAYQAFMKEIFRLDPSNAMISFNEMMKAQIVMPAELMNDPINPNLYDDFSRVAQKIGVYTAVDYANIIAYLVKEFKAETMTGLNAEAQAAQASVCALPKRYGRLAERSMKGIMAQKDEDLLGKFSWLRRVH
uniref:Chloroplast acyl-ACP desaturase n=1 Tax=Diacronema viridis TaxID=2793420 RepID=A7LBP8_9EUKA|nr:chloroplast acyl-ACP desaturase [Diacronema viridis]